MGQPGNCDPAYPKEVSVARSLKERRSMVWHRVETSKVLVNLVEVEPELVYQGEVGGRPGAGRDEPLGPELGKENETISAAKSGDGTGEDLRLPPLYVHLHERRLEMSRGEEIVKASGAYRHGGAPVSGVIDTVIPPVLVVQ